MPARSDGPDNVDGGPDAADIAPGAVPGKWKCPIYAARRPFWTPVKGYPQRLPRGADGLDDGDGGTNAALDIEIRIIQDVGVCGRL